MWTQIVGLFSSEGWQRGGSASRKQKQACEKPHRTSYQSTFNERESTLFHSFFPYSDERRSSTRQDMGSRASASVLMCVSFDARLINIKRCQRAYAIPYSAHDSAYINMRCPNVSGAIRVPRFQILDTHCSQTFIIIFMTILRS